MATSCRGVTSSRTARAAGSSAIDPTLWPVTSSPPAASSSATRAVAIASAPPRTIGQPTAWAEVARTSPNDAVNGRSSRSIEWAATPANIARAGASRKRPLASPCAERSAGRPNRASASGWRGRWTTGWRISGPSLAHPDASGPTVAARPARRLAEPVRRRAHRAFQDGRPTIVERVRERSVRLDQLDTAGGEIDRCEEGRADRQRQDRRADIVAKSGERQLGGPGATARRRRCLVDPDRSPGPRQGDRRGQTVRPGPDDDRIDRTASDRVAHETPGLTPGRSACGRARSGSVERTGSSRCCERSASSAIDDPCRCRRSSSRLSAARPRRRSPG